MTYACFIACPSRGVHPRGSSRLIPSDSKRPARDDDFCHDYYLPIEAGASMLAFCGFKALRELRRGAAGVGAEAAPQPMRLYHVKAGCGRRKLLRLSCIALAAPPSLPFIATAPR